MGEPKISAVLKRLMFEKGIRAMDLARLAHVPQPTVQRIVAGTTPNPHLASLLPIAKFFGLTIEQLKGLEPIPGFEPHNVNPAFAHLKEVPLISWQEAFDWVNKMNDFPLKANKTLAVDIPVSSSAFAVTLQDSSMLPVFTKGTQLIIDPDKKAHDRSFVVASLKDQPEAVFRQLLIDAKHRYLKPLSPDLEQFKMISLGEEDKICGVLVQARKNFEDY